MNLKSEPSRSELKSPIQWFVLFLSGMCMGAADLVPGISGGTIAFILGFYQDLIFSIQTINTQTLTFLFRGQFKSFFSKVAWKFLLVVIGGILLSIVIFAHALHFFLGHEVYRIYLYSFFWGLILASIYVCAKKVKTWSPKLFIPLWLGGCAAYVLSGTSLQNSRSVHTYSVPIVKNYESTHAIVNYNPETQILTGVTPSSLSVMLAKGDVLRNTIVEDASGQQFFVETIAKDIHGLKIDFWIATCGAIAICALLLPGISGSYLLTLLGVYGIVLSSLIDFIRGVQQLRVDLEALSVLLSLIIGIVFGGVAFSRAIYWLLKWYQEVTIVGLIGFIIGALPTVWPFWSYQYALDPLHLDKGAQLMTTTFYLPSMNSLIFLQSLTIMVSGFFLVILLEKVASISCFSYKTR